MSQPGPRRPTAAPPDAPSAQPIDLQDLFWRLRRYGWVLVLPIVACLCVAALYARGAVPIYQAALVISVDNQADVSNAMRPYAPGGAIGGQPRERIALIDGKIHNHSFLKAVAERIGMDKDPVLLARATAATKLMTGITPGEHAIRLAVAQLWTKISVSQGRGTAIQISVRDESPERARDLASIIGDALLEKSLQATLEKVQARGEFSKDQSVVLEERVRQAEDALRTFQESRLRRNITAGLSSEAELQQAQVYQRSTEEEIAQLRSRLLSSNEEWRGLSGGATMPVLSSARADELGNQLIRHETGAVLIQIRGADKTGEGAAFQGRITATRQALFVEFDRLAQAAEGGLSPEAQNTAAGIALDRAVLRSLQARNDRLAGVIREYVSAVQSSPRDQIELQRLQDNVTSARSLLTTMRNETATAGVSEAYATSQMGPRIEILEHPLLPLQPSSLGARATYAVAFFLALVIDAAIVFAGERLAAVVRTVEQAEAEYGLRVVGVVPRIDTRPRPGGYLRNHWPKFAIVAVLLVSALFVVFDEFVFPHPNPTKPAQVQK
ncbi:MAG TPA: Wzz/FepE/Etk N-terminal domain-containing protein [Candidatus Eisenbacteria bacterium]|nr:Wzz/FepE/Etk N-terminal domain-containing protein [Candidatus Eisenbacteria bacterium]